MNRLACALLATLLAAPALADAMFRGDAARSGVFEGSGLRTLEGTRWVFRTPGPVAASPVILDGVVYAASMSGHVYAIDLATGQERWSFKSRLPVTSTPAVAGGTVYFVSSAGSLVALDASNGQPRWVAATEYERRFEARGLHGYAPTAQTIADAWDVWTSSPAISGGKVYYGSGDGNVYAVDAASGVLLWKFPTGNVVHGSPAVSRGTVYVGSWDGYVYALDADSGQQKWAFKGGEDPVMHNQVGFQSSPTVVDGTVYIGSRDAHVYALDALTGRKKWDYPTSKSWVNTSPAVANGLVYAATSDSSRFMALDARSGRLRFNIDAGAYVFSSPALAGGLAYFGAHNGRVYAVDAANGALAWEFVTEGARKDPLGLLTPEGRLNRAAFAPVFGDFQDMYIDAYRFTTVGAVMSSPAVADGVVVVGSMDGNVYALH
jgi:outer membrane protein assembly factor BamB